MIPTFVFSCQREGNDPEDYSRLTYKKLLEEVCRFANVLKSKGLAKGDRAALYMPMVLETVVAMLACSRIGVVHSVVVSHFDKVIRCILIILLVRLFVM